MRGQARRGFLVDTHRADAAKGASPAVGQGGWGERGRYRCCHCRATRRTPAAHAITLPPLRSGLGLKGSGLRCAWGSESSQGTIEEHRTCFSRAALVWERKQLSCHTSRLTHAGWCLADLRTCHVFKHVRKGTRAQTDMRAGASKHETRALVTRSRPTSSHVRRFLSLLLLLVCQVRTRLEKRLIYGAGPRMVDVGAGPEETAQVLAWVHGLVAVRLHNHLQ